MPDTRLAYLLSRYFRDTATQGETDELMLLMNKPENRIAVEEAMASEWESFVEPATPVFSAGKSSVMLANVLPARRKDLHLLRWVGAIAASLMLFIAAYWLITGRDMLTTRPSAGESSKMYKTLTTEKGKQLQVQLPDGSRVWLNATTSLRYPASFDGDRRVVELTGEAYFDVAPDAGKPFFVKTAGLQVEVLGTAFNVNAYPDEPVRLTTLLSGSIAVSDHLLRPGQQAVTQPSGETHIRTIDTTQAIAWKHGVFSFHQADLPTVMRQFVRWYDIRVEYSGKIPEITFSGKIGRDLTLSQILRILSDMQISYRMEAGGKLLILPGE